MKVIEKFIMLKTRILTAVFLLPISIWLILFANYNLFAYMTAGIIILAAYEWFKLLNIKNKKEFIGYLIIFCSILLYGISNYNFQIKNNSLCLIFILNMIFWFIATLLIIIYSIKKIKFHNFCLRYPIIWKIFNLISCFIVLLPSWLAINYMKHNNVYYLLQLILVIIAIDTGGYIGGKLLGKRKLSIVSPNKTWEGILIGYLIAILIMIIFLTFNNKLINELMNNIFDFKFLYIAINANLILILAILGDLFESLLKRIANVKDSGHILPGHGGILDRFDSILAVTPTAALSYFVYF